MNYATNSYNRSGYVEEPHHRQRNIHLPEIILMMYIGYAIAGSTSNTYLYIMIGLFLLWVLINTLSTSKRLVINVSDKKTIAFILYAVFICLSGIWVSGAFFTAKQLGSAMLLFSPIFIFDHYARADRIKTIRILLYFSLAMWMFLEIQSLVFFNEYKNAARVLASDNTAYGDVAIGGGYGLAYGSALLSIVILDVILFRQLSKKKIFVALVFLVSSAFVVIQTQSSVTIVCWVSGIGTCLLLRPSKDNSKTKALRIILLLLIVVIVYFCIKPFGNWLMDISSGGDSAVSGRMYSLGAALAGRTGGSDYAINRLSIPIKSLKTFLNHPLFGVSYLHGNGFLYSGDFGVGRHCEWVDALADYGLIGGIPFLAMYFFQVLELTRSKPKISPGLWVCLLPMGLFNPFRTVQSQFALFFIIPGILTLLRTSKKAQIVKGKML